MLINRTQVINVFILKDFSATVEMTTERLKKEQSFPMLRYLLT